MVEGQQQIFRAATDTLQGAAAEGQVEIGGDRLTQGGVANHDPAHCDAEQVRRNSPTGGFNFGQFWHRGKCA